ncbi:hypothetical protein, partial [Klebsiella pneumoniae]|uniref:hypothetical protein n=1 Tax=Klebsiella pneumoniae TaxID=573 RepID=UPI00272F379E
EGEHLCYFIRACSSGLSFFFSSHLKKKLFSEIDINYPSLLDGGSPPTMDFNCQIFNKNQAKEKG